MPQPVFRSLQQLDEAVWRESSDRGITPFVSQGSASLPQREEPARGEPLSGWDTQGESYNF